MTQATNRQRLAVVRVILASTVMLMLVLARCVGLTFILEVPRQAKRSLSSEDTADRWVAQISIQTHIYSQRFLQHSLKRFLIDDSREDLANQWIPAS